MKLSISLKTTIFRILSISFLALSLNGANNKSSDLLSGLKPIQTWEAKAFATKEITKAAESAVLSRDITPHPQYGEIREITITERKQNPWAVMDMFIFDNAGILAKENMLVSLWVKCVSSEDESGAGSFQIMFKGLVPESKKPDLIKPVTVGNDWQQIVISFSTSSEIQKFQLVFVLGGTKPQVLQIADLKIMNFKNSVTLADLPISKTTYAGMEPDAPWRKAAAARIEQIRKVDAKIILKNSSKKSVSTIPVRAELVTHSFGWGTAVNEMKLFGGKATPEEAEKFKQIVIQNFNKVVIENGMKWKLYPQMKSAVDSTVAWAKANNLPMRGHVLVWPAFQRSTPDVLLLKDNPAALKKRIEDHVVDFASKWKGDIVEWDVLNEPFSQHEFMDILGKEVILDWFKLAKATDPSTKNYINDFEIIAGNNQAHRDNYHEWISYMVANNAPFDGIGFQSHFRAPVPPEVVYSRFEEFTKYDKDLQVTEYDFDDTDEELQAAYLRDYMTLTFSHPKMIGFMIWTLWEQNTSKPQAAFYKKDWTPTKQALMWQEMTKKTWSTSINTKPDASGNVNFRGFKGQYKVSVGAGKDKKDYFVSIENSTPIEIAIP